MQPPPNDNSTVKGGVNLADVRAAIAPVLVTHGVTLVELTWQTDRGGWTLRLTIERPGSSDASGGVTLDDCAEVSRDVSALLDVEDLIAQHYNLEVSSPGLDRKLHGPADFVRFRGQLAKVKLTRPAPDGQRVLRGTLEAAAEGRVVVRVDGKLVDVPLADVDEARLVFELTTGQKKGKPKGGSKAKPSAQKSDKSAKKASEAAEGTAAAHQDRGGPQR